MYMKLLMKFVISFRTSIGPGPKYKLKTLVGYDDHCYSRLRNPAYSIAYKQTGGSGTCGPGPQYLIRLSRKPGFSIGARWNTNGKFLNLKKNSNL